MLGEDVEQVMIGPIVLLFCNRVTQVVIRYTMVVYIVTLDIFEVGDKNNSGFVRS